MRGFLMKDFHIRLSSHLQKMVHLKTMTLLLATMMALNIGFTFSSTTYSVNSKTPRTTTSGRNIGERSSKEKNSPLQLGEVLEKPIESANLNSPQTSPPSPPKNSSDKTSPTQSKTRDHKLNAILLNILLLLLPLLIAQLRGNASRKKEEKIEETPSRGRIEKDENKVFPPTEEENDQMEDQKNDKNPSVDIPTQTPIPKADHFEDDDKELIEDPSDIDTVEDPSNIELIEDPSEDLISSDVLENDSDGDTPIDEPLDDLLDSSNDDAIGFDENEFSNELNLYQEGEFEYLFPPNMDPQEKYNRTLAIQDNVALSKQIIRDRVDKRWDLIQKYLPFQSKEDAYAFFLGVTTLESTFNPSVVTGGGHTGYANQFMTKHGDSAHAIGLLQTAETGFQFNENNDLGWKNEVVEGYPHAPLEGKYYYDPVVNADMGIRKMLHFGQKAAETMGKTPEEAAKSQDFWALVLKGHNTGWATYEEDAKNGGNPFDPDWWEFYAKTVGTSGNFLKTEGHLDDDVKTWHTDPKLEKYNNNGNYLEWLT
jgi:hypothetical protein